MKDAELGSISLGSSYVRSHPRAFNAIHDLPLGSAVEELCGEGRESTHPAECALALLPVSQ